MKFVAWYRYLKQLLHGAGKWVPGDGRLVQRLVVLLLDGAHAPAAQELLLCTLRGNAVGGQEAGGLVKVS